MQFRFSQGGFKNYRLSKIHGFTLVELLVIIAILAILTVVGFLLLGNTTTTARDSQRIANIRQLHDATRLQAASLHTLPMPYQAVPISLGGGSGTIDLTASGATSQYAVFVDGSTQLSTLTGSKLLALTRDGGVDTLLAGGTLSGTLSNQNLGWQGYADASIAGSLNYSDTVDPQDQALFTYRLGQNRDRSQFLAYLENPENENSTPLLWNIADPVNAATSDYTKRYPYVWGDRLGIVLDKGSNAPVQQGLTPPVNNSGSTGSGNTIDTSGMMVGVGRGHSCFLKADQSIVCWGDGSDGQTSVPSGLTDVVQISAGQYHSCALQSDGVVACWGQDWEEGRIYGVENFSSLPSSVHEFELTISGPSDVIQVSAGGYHTCALKSNGIVQCVGGDWDGQSTPPPLLSNAIQISAGEQHTCALKSGGTVECWGNNSYGQTDVPSGLSGVVQVSTGQYYTCALKSDGTIICWGDNSYDQSTPPSGLSNVTQVSTDSLYTCALKSDGTVVCWGGYDPCNDGCFAVYPNSFVSGLNNIVQISVGYEYACALKSDGGVECWNTDGSVQVPEEIQVFPVILNSIIFDDHRLTNGNNFTCAITSTGGVECWGANDVGQLDIPVGLDNVLEINAGHGFACALKSDGSVVCWGESDVGQTDVPVGLNGVVQMSVGYSNVCALKSNGTVVCWGDNSDGQTNVPSELNHIVQVATGWNFACALKDTGRIACWGQNYSGLQNPPSDIGTVKQISAGDEHMCAVKTDDSVVCWGSNSDLSSTSDVAHVSAGEYYSCLVHTDGSVECGGDNGDGQTDVPMTLSGVTEISTSMGGSHTCALKSDSTIVCWGRDADGQITVPTSFGGVSLGPISGVVFDETRMSAGAYFTCALKSDATVECWGKNDADQLTVPSGLSNVTQITSGLAHTCALKSDGSVVCWGSNSDNQLNITSGLSDVVELSAGGNHTCALKSDGTVECWGSNSDNQLNITPGLSDVVEVVSGLNYSCALRQDRSISCWGSNDHYVLDVPANVTRVTQISAGYNHMCALKDSGRMICWGDLSDTITNVSHIFAANGYSCTLKADASVECFGGPSGIPMPSLSDILAVGVGSTHACSIGIGDQINCWGSDWYGESDIPVDLGGTPPSTPLNLTGPIFDDQILTSGHTHTCVVTRDSTVECWGPNWSNQVNVPIGLSDVIQVASGPFRSCALKSDGTVECWGDPGFSVPPDVSNIVQIAVADWGACALKSDGTIACWNIYGNDVLNNSVPTDLTFAGVAVSSNDICLLKSTGDLFCVWSNQIFHDVAQASGGMDNDICLLHSDATVTCTNSTSTSGLSDVMKVTDGRSHACALKSDGTVACWGANEFGQRNVPSDLANVVDISAGWYHTCALRSDAHIVCWGNNSYGQGTIPPAAELTLISDYVQEDIAISLGADHSCFLNSGSVSCSSYNEEMQQDVLQVSAGTHYTCILKSNGTVECNGINDSGQLNIPLGLNNVIQISAGDRHVCALKSDESLVCWGDRTQGPGYYNTVKACTENYCTMVKQVSAGVYNSCAVLSDETVRCWGDQGYYGYAGENTAPGITGVVQVSVGTRHACALQKNGHVVCWGNNLVAPSWLDDAVQISSGFGLSCARRVSGNVVCWGGYHENASQMAALTDAIEVAVSQGTYYMGDGWSANVCVLKSDQNIVCWPPHSFVSTNAKMQLLFPNVLSFGSGVTGSPSISYDEGRIAAGTYFQGQNHYCFITDSTGVECVGDNTNGQTDVPVGLTGVVQLESTYNTCALKSDGTVVCWGYNPNVGDVGTTSFPFPLTSVAQISRSNDGNHPMTCIVRFDSSADCWGVGGIPDDFPHNLTSIRQIDVAHDLICAVRDIGTVECWGGWGWNYYGQLTIPSGLTNIVQVTSSDSYDPHTCALKSDGTVVCWGSNPNQPSTIAYITVPNDLSDVVQIAAGDHHTCAVKSTGSVQCWGENYWGQLNVPSGLSGVVSISASQNYTCAITNTDATTCWGNNIP